ncbi:MAG: hypothetical protein IT539_08110 [Bradyrhizobiaceae bacterium]|nr:hypothetical protein [Bradyrhizobiaceae bacterium]
MQDDKPLDPAQNDVVRRLRRLMLFSTLIMIAGFAVIFGVIAYRLSTIGEEVGPIAANVSLPKGARVLSTAVAGDRLIVTIESDGGTEVRIFDLATLQQRGRLTLERQP